MNPFLMTACLLSQLLLNHHQPPQTAKPEPGVIFVPYLSKSSVWVVPTIRHGIPWETFKGVRKMSGTEIEGKSGPSSISYSELSNLRGADVVYSAISNLALVAHVSEPVRRVQDTAIRINFGSRTKASLLRRRPRETRLLRNHGLFRCR